MEERWRKIQETKEESEGIMISCKHQETGFINRPPCLITHQCVKRQGSLLTKLKLKGREGSTDYEDRGNGKQLQEMRRSGESRNWQNFDSIHSNGRDPRRHQREDKVGTATEIREEINLEGKILVFRLS